MTTATAQRQITAEDLFLWKWVSEPRLAPDGSAIAFTVKEVDRDGNGYASRIWSVAPDGSDLACLTSGPKSDWSPRWSPRADQMAFLSDRNGSAQIWLRDLSGTATRQLTDLPHPPTNITWSPDGSRLAFLSRVPSSPPRPMVEGSDVLVINRLAYKQDGQGWWDGTYTHLFVGDVGSGEVRALTQGAFDVSAPCWSPDGKMLAFAGNLSSDADYTYVRDIHVIPAEGGEPRRVTPSQGPSSLPAWSPDGEWIAFFGHDNQHDRAGNVGVWVVRPDGRDLRLLTDGWDYTAGNTIVSDMLAWGSPARGPVPGSDGASFYFIATVGGAVELYRVTLTGNTPERILGGNRVVSEFDYCPATDMLAAVVSDPTRAGEVIVSQGDGSNETSCTAVNAWLTDLDLSEPERIEFAGDGGVPVEGWILKPPGFDPARQYPMILQIHGGSHLTYGYTFCHEFQFLAASGYAVFYANPRGSQGYGVDFSASIRHDWGGKEYRDLMHGVDAVLELGYVDANRLGVAGGSFGGYLTNWIIGHTDRFGAAVTQRCTSNRYSNWGTSDWGWLNGTWEWPGNPWDSTEFYMERSPISYVDRITTPLLILHSDQDHRCAVEQAEQLFTALKWLRKDVEWVLFHNESHGLSRSGRPLNRLERLQRIVSWFDRHLGRS